MTRTITAALLTLALGCNGSAGKPSTAEVGDAGTGADATGSHDAAAATDGSPAPGRVTLTNVVPGAPDGLAWVAYQDGDGPWQAVDGKSGVYTIPVAGPRYGLAYLCDLGTLTAGEIIHATVAELPALSTACDPRMDTKHLTVNVTGLDPQVQVAVSVGNAATGVDQPIDTKRRFDYDVPAGRYDVVGVALTGQQVTKMAFAREVDVTSDATAALDFSVEHRPQGRSLALTGAQGQGLTSFVTLTTALGVQVSLPGGGNTYYSLARADLAPGDMQELTVSATNPVMGALYEGGVVVGLGEPQGESVTLPPAFTSAQLAAIAGASYLRPRLTFTAYPGATMYQLSAQGSTQTLSRQWLVILGASWLGANTSYDFPDFSGVRGWKASWALQPKDDLLFEADAVQSSRDFARTINSDHASSAGSKLSYAKAILQLAP